MRWLFRSIVAAGFLFGLLLGFFFDVARAQEPTSTPTPLYTPIPTPTVTPTPAPTAVYTGTGSYVWGCLLYGVGMAPVCTWGDYFEIWGQAADGAVDEEFEVAWPTSNFARYVLLPPTDTKEIRATCSVYLEWFASQSTSDSAVFGWGHGSLAPGLAHELYIDGVKVSSKTWEISDSLDFSENMDLVQVVDTVDVRFRLKDGQSSWYSDIPGQYNDYLYYSRFNGWAKVMGVAATGAEIYSSSVSRMACEINEIERLDGSVYVPESQPVGDATPTPGPYQWEDYEWVDYGPYYQAPPQNSSFSFSESSSQCFQVLPGASFTIAPSWLSTWFGLPELGVSWVARSLCLDQWTISGELMNVPVSSMVGGFISALIILWMLRTLRGTGG